MENFDMFGIYKSTIEVKLSNFLGCNSFLLIFSMISPSDLLPENKHS